MIPHQQPKIFKSLASQIPINEYGLPAYLLDVNKLFHNAAPNPLSIQDYDYYVTLANANIAEAIIELDYDEGYPIIPATGHPIWEPFTAELTNAHIAAQLEKYIKMPQLAAIAASQESEPEPELLTHAYMRSLRFITSSQQELQELYMHATVYHWATRAKAYDMYYLAADTKRREQLQRQQEHTQFNSAKRLGEQAEAIMQQMLAEPALWEVKPSDVIRLYQISTKFQRSAIGLTDSPQQEQPQLISATALLQQIGASQTSTIANTLNNQIEPEQLEQLEQLYFAKGGERHAITQS